MRVFSYILSSPREQALASSTYKYPERGPFSRIATGEIFWDCARKNGMDMPG
jgi:hypothetical protein